ncbi:MAG: MFS transporter [Candidatus Korarchaeota archaeon]|nr:MFS transporter [Candidatus Korarchaeota archaeon]
MTEMINGIRELERDLKLLLIASIPTGLSGGMFYAVWGLYFETEGVNVSLLGLYSFLEGLLMAAVFIPAGLITDKMGRKKPVLIGYMFSAVSLAIVSLWGLNLLAIIVSGILGGCSSLALPAFQAWLADLAGSRMEEASSIQMFLYSVSFSAGSLMGWVPELMVMSSRDMNYSQAYRMMILLSMLATLIAIPFFLATKDKKMACSTANHPITLKDILRPLNSSMIRRLTFLLVLSSLATGFFYPLTSYYLGEKYGVESGPVGTVLSLIYLISSFSYLVAPVFSKLLGLVKFIVLSQGFAILVMALIPLTQDFLLASTLLILQVMGTYAPFPLIWALFMEYSPPDERGMVNSLYNLSVVGPRAISSLAGGNMMSISLEYPIFAFILLYSLYNLLFATLVRSPHYKKSYLAKVAENTGDENGFEGQDRCNTTEA